MDSDGAQMVAAYDVQAGWIGNVAYTRGTRGGGPLAGRPVTIYMVCIYATSRTYDPEVKYSGTIWLLENGVQVARVEADGRFRVLNQHESAAVLAYLDLVDGYVERAQARIREARFAT